MKKIFLISLLLPTLSWSAGYLDFDVNGTPFKWNSADPIDFHTDNGSLGAISEGLADTLVTQAFAAWAAVPSSTLTFNDGGETAVDITTVNLTTYVDFNGVDCETPDFVVVYDSDGSIFTSLFGAAGAASILGLATPSVLDNATKQITCGYSLLNGALASDSDSVKYTLMHEFGHAQNLAHSQINADITINASDSDDQYIPLMFPIIPGSVTDALLGGIGGIKLDDQFSLLQVYNPTVLNTEGRIRGHILKKDETGVLGVNVVCYDKDNARENVVSWVSDAELDGEGEYTCGHLPAGDYEVRIEPVEVAINVWEQGTPPFIPTEYYNGSNESFSSKTDVLSEKTQITVPSATTVDSIDLFINDDGKITSEKTVTGTVTASGNSDLEYFIYVPQSATKVTFDLTADSSGSDIDLYGKCDDPFSLATGTAGPFYDPTGDDQQADFAGAGSDGIEQIILDSSSVPKLANCEYHLIIQNYEASDVGFELKATIEGKVPELKADFQPTKQVQDNGETLVSSIAFEAENDQFTINSITFTDVGITSLSDVSGAAFYEDVNGNGAVDDDDIQLSTTASVNATTRQMSFANLSIFIAEGARKNFLVTYDIPAASSSLPLALMIVGVLFSALFLKSGKTKTMLAVLFFTMMLSRCSGSSDNEFDPRIQKDEDISAEASGFGSQFSVEVGVPSSVKDFFD